MASVHKTWTEIWRAAVEKELAGASFEKTLVSETAEGLRIEPVYFDGAPNTDLLAAMARRQGPRICVACDDTSQVREAIEGGADAVWLAAGLSVDAVACECVGDEGVVSSLPYHAAGADAADEIAALLSLGVAYMRTKDHAPMLRISVGRDTFGELCKLRALRLCWGKALVAAGLPMTQLRVHAVCATRTLAARDPWVNMLRVTTQAFAAMLGGADLVTPQTFDAAIGAQTALGRRVARNTALVLREESQLDRVIDPAAGSYYLEHRTSALAQLAWRRFQALEREGGVGPAFDARVAEAWNKREVLLARRKEPVLGVSEFANLDEERPTPIHPVDLGHRDSEAFEELRDRAAQRTTPVITLVTLGPPAEHRARLGFAQALFPVGGLRTELGPDGDVVCLCGSDERYAAEAMDRARGLKAAGSKRVLLAGRPGTLEAALREAGVDDFVFVGSDVVLALRAVLEVLT